MAIRQFAVRVSWPLCLTIVAAIVLLWQWYFALSYLTYGDFFLTSPQAVLPDAFHLWTFSSEIGNADSVTWWPRALMGALFFLHANEPLVERLVFFYFPPPIFIAGLYVLAKSLTNDSTAAGVASLCGFLNVEFLVRLIGGHESALMPIALAPWAVWGALEFVHTRRVQWFAFIVLTMAAATAYDARWTLPVLFVMLVVAITVKPSGGLTRPVSVAGVISAAAIGLILPNLSWLVPLISSGAAVSPVPPAQNFDPQWVSRLSLANLFDALAIWNPTFGSSFDRGPLVVSHLPAWGLLLPLCIFAGAMVSRTRLALAFLGLYLVGVFLYKGSEPPFGTAYLWAFKHVPLFDLYREPLKFGAAASLCASMVLALGIAALYKRTVERRVYVTVACAVIVALAAPAFAKPGMRVARAPDPAYGRLAQVLDGDPEFSRVLWLPQGSRWLAGTGLHPFAGADQLGLNDWMPFRSKKGTAEDPTAYIYSQVFEQLLRWNSFRYVVVDCSTEADATYRSDSYSCAHILTAMRTHHALRSVFSKGPLKLFRISGPSAPAIWSSPIALNAQGPLLAFNAGVLAGAFPGFVPVMRVTENTVSLPFKEEIVLDGGATAPRNSPVPVARVVGADSIDIGPSMGDGVIDHQRVPKGARLQFVATAPSTIAFDGAIAGSILEGLHRLSRYDVGTLLVRGQNENLPLFQPAKISGIETQGMSIPLYDAPVIRIVANGPADAGRLASVFELRDRESDQRYTLVGPAFAANALPPDEFDIRDWLFRTIIENPRYDHALGSGDRFDRLVLTRIRLVQLDPNRTSRQRFFVTVRARRAYEGYLVRSGSRATAFGPTGWVMPRFGVRSGDWRNGVLAIHSVPQSYTGLILKRTPRMLRGITMIDDVPFSLREDQIQSIQSAPDVASIDLHLSCNLCGVLYLRGVVDRRVKLQVLLRAESANRWTWIVRDVPSVNSVGKNTPFLMRLSVSALAARFGYDRVTEISLLLIRRLPKDQSSAGIRIDDAAIVSDAPGHAATSHLRIAANTATTNLGSGMIPIAARFSASHLQGAGVAPHAIVPSQRSVFKDGSGNRWLVFSEKFDPGWTLAKVDGRPVAAVHLPAYGLLNAWYIPSGLHGSYRIVYGPDITARVASTAFLFFFLVCGLLSLTQLRYMFKKGGASAASHIGGASQ